MNDFGFNDYNALFQRMYGPRPEKDKAGWLDPALTAAGAIAGTMLMPGAGTAAGASLGHAAGGAAHSAVNGNAQGAMQGAMGLPAFWQQFAPYIGTFAEGGPVPEIEQTDEYGNPIQPQGQVQPQQPLSMLTPELIAQIQQHAQTLAGPAPSAPTAAPLRQPSHPTLEALATLMPTILGSLPKPANPKNTKAIGAWAPFAGNALAAPALIAQARRKAANAPIEDANTQAQSDYEARQKAYEDQKKAYGTALIQGAMRPQGSVASNELDRPMTAEESVRVTGTKDWAGYTLRQWGARNKPKSSGDPSTGNGTTISERAKRIGQAIVEGKLPPSYVRSLAARDPDRGGVLDYIATRGYDANTAEFAITAEKKFWSTQNDSKRTSMRTLLGTLQHSIPYTRSLVRRAKEIIPELSISGFNSAALAVAANMPGERGALARNLQAQILDISSEVGGLYMGGNSNTDESFRVAQANISSNWNEEQLMAALDQIEVNAGIRRAAMKDVGIYKPEPKTPPRSLEEY